MLKNFYTILGVPRHANQKQIKSAYAASIKKARKEKDEELEKEANIAYGTLGDPDRRAEYDTQLAQADEGEKNTDMVVFLPDDVADGEHLAVVPSDRINLTQRLLAYKDHMALAQHALDSEIYASAVVNHQELLRRLIINDYIHSTFHGLSRLVVKFPQLADRVKRQLPSLLDGSHYSHAFILKKLKEIDEKWHRYIGENSRFKQILAEAENTTVLDKTFSQLDREVQRRYLQSESIPRDALEFFDDKLIELCLTDPDILLNFLNNSNSTLLLRDLIEKYPRVQETIPTLLSIQKNFWDRVKHKPEYLLIDFLFDSVPEIILADEGLTQLVPLNSLRKKCQQTPGLRQRLPSEKANVLAQFESIWSHPEKEFKGDILEHRLFLPRDLFDIAKRSVHAAKHVLNCKTLREKLYGVGWLSSIYEIVSRVSSNKSFLSKKKHDFFDDIINHEDLWTYLKSNSVEISRFPGLHPIFFRFIFADPARIKACASTTWLTQAIEENVALFSEAIVTLGNAFPFDAKAFRASVWESIFEKLSQKAFVIASASPHVQSIIQDRDRHRRIMQLQEEKRLKTPAETRDSLEVSQTSLEKKWQWQYKHAKTLLDGPHKKNAIALLIEMAMNGYVPSITKLQQLLENQECKIAILACYKEWLSANQFFTVLDQLSLFPEAYSSLQQLHQKIGILIVKSYFSRSYFNSYCYQNFGFNEPFFNQAIADLNRLAEQGVFFSEAMFPPNPAFTLHKKQSPRLTDSPRVLPWVEKLGMAMQMVSFIKEMDKTEICQDLARLFRELLKPDSSTDWRHHLKKLILLQYISHCEPSRLPHDQIANQIEQELQRYSGTLEEVVSELRQSNHPDHKLWIAQLYLVDTLNGNGESREQVNKILKGSDNELTTFVTKYYLSLPKHDFLEQSLSPFDTPGKLSPWMEQFIFKQHIQGSFNDRQRRVANFAQHADILPEVFIFVLQQVRTRRIVDINHVLHNIFSQPLPIPVMLGKLCNISPEIQEGLALFFTLANHFRIPEQAITENQIEIISRSTWCELIIENPEVFNYIFTENDKSKDILWKLLTYNQSLLGEILYRQSCRQHPKWVKKYFATYVTKRPSYLSNSALYAYLGSQIDTLWKHKDVRDQIKGIIQQRGVSFLVPIPEQCKAGEPLHQLLKTGEFLWQLVMENNQDVDFVKILLTYPQGVYCIKRYLIEKKAEGDQQRALKYQREDFELTVDIAANAQRKHSCVAEDLMRLTAFLPEGEDITEAEKNVRQLCLIVAAFHGALKAFDRLIMMGELTDSTLALLQHYWLSSDSSSKFINCPQYFLQHPEFFYHFGTRLLKKQLKEIAQARQELGDAWSRFFSTPEAQEAKRKYEQAEEVIFHIYRCGIPLLGAGTELANMTPRQRKACFASLQKVNAKVNAMRAEDIVVPPPIRELKETVGGHLRHYPMLEKVLAEPNPVIGLSRATKKLYRVSLEWKDNENAEHKPQPHEILQARALLAFFESYDPNQNNLAGALEKQLLSELPVQTQTSEKTGGFWDNPTSVVERVPTTERKDETLYAAL